MVTFEVHVDTVLAAPRLALADDDGGHDLLPEVGLPLLEVAMTMSPTQADGRRLSLPLMPLTEMM